MGVDNDGTVIIIAESSYVWLDTLLDECIVSQIEIANDFSEFEAIISEQLADIILVEENLFSDELPIAIEQIKLLSPRSLIATLTTDSNNEHYDSVVALGVADVLPIDVKSSVMTQRINALMYRWHDQMNAESRTRRLQAISILSQRLYEAENASIMFVTTIDFICNHFDVLGVAITLQNSDGMRLYAGSQDIDNHRRLYESHSMMNVHDPLRQVIITGMPLVFANISEYDHYTPIPVIPKPQSAIVVPFRNASRIIGSLAIFADDDSLSWEDVAMFELIALNLGTAHFNITHYNMQEVNVKSMRYVIQAWYRLSKVYDRKEIAELATKQITNVINRASIGIWLFSQDDEPDLIYSEHTALRDVLIDTSELDTKELILQDFEHSLRPVTLHHRMLSTSPITHILDVLNATQITFIPISGDTFNGIIVAVPDHSEELSYSDISLIESLAQVVAKTLERNLLIETLQREQGKLQEQTGRIEGVLSSIHEGIVFINHDKIIEYCNPQFSELTGLMPVDILEQPIDGFIKSLVKHYDETDAKRIQLETAAYEIISGELSTHPIVELEDSSGSKIHVEFMPASFTRAHEGCICVVAPRVTIEAPQNLQDVSWMDDMLEEISEPLVALNAKTSSLHEQYELLGRRKFGQVITELDHSTSALQTKWSSFLQIYKGETHGYDVALTSLDIADFMSDLFNSRYLQPFKEKIQIDSRVLSASVDLDERLMQQTLANLVANILNTHALVSMIVDVAGTNVRFHLQGEKTSTYQKNTSLSVSVTEEDDDLFLPEIHLAEAIIALHSGELSITREGNNPVAYEIKLPLLDAEDAPVVEDINRYKPSTEPLTVVVLESQSRLSEPLLPYIKAQGHQVFLETTLNDTILDLRMSKVDIILLEATHDNLDVLDCIQRIRNHSEVPIVIFSTQEFEHKCIAGLQQGADDYYLTPINRDKFLAHLHPISNRQDLAARTSEPIIVGDLKVDLSRRRVYLNNEPVDLTTREYQILQVLVMKRGEVMSHAEILSKVWGPEYKEEKQYLWVNISRLRQKIEPPDDSPRYIQNEPRVGYVFAVD